MRVVIILNPVLAGVGTKEDVHLPLNATKEMTGIAKTLQSMMIDFEEYLMVSISLGEKTYEENKEIVQRKIKGMLARLKADAVICGPSFDSKEFSEICVELAEDIQKNTSVLPICAMAKENEEIIDAYKEKITIVRMPRKGEGGLQTSLENIATVLKKKSENAEESSYKSLIYDKGE